jgi:pimeloyl-ACP methyl ester carboxylesterase
MWKYQVGPLVDMGYRVVRYDVRGHGRTTSPVSGYTWDNYSRDLSELLGQLPPDRADGEAVSAVHLVGLSMGGGIALKFALDDPGRVTSLTLVDSTLPGFAYSDEFAVSFQGLREAVRSEGAKPAFERLWLPHPLFDGLRRHPDKFEEAAEMVAGFRAAEYLPEAEMPDYVQPDLPSRLGEVAAPTLVIVGADDLPDFQLIAEVVSENIADARKVVLSGCGHTPPMEDSAALNRTLLEFLATIRN